MFKSSKYIGLFSMKEKDTHFKSRNKEKEIKGYVCFKDV